MLQGQIQGNGDQQIEEQGKNDEEDQGLLQIGLELGGSGVEREDAGLIGMVHRTMPHQRAGDGGGVVALKPMPSGRPR
jgi:hypothetical protein